MQLEWLSKGSQKTSAVGRYFVWQFRSLCILEIGSKTGPTNPASVSNSDLLEFSRHQTTSLPGSARTNYGMIAAIVLAQLPETPNKVFRMDGNGQTTISCVKIWNHAIETTNCKFLFQVPGIDYALTLLVFTVFFLQNVCVCVSVFSRDLSKKQRKTAIDYCLPHEVDKFSVFFLLLELHHFYAEIITVFLNKW